MQQTTHPGLIRKQIGSSQRLSREHRSRIANALMHLVNDGCFVAIYPILPLITLEFDLKYARVILLNTVLTASSTAFQIPMALASLAILPLTGLYHWSRTAMLSLLPQQHPQFENAR